MLRHLLPLRSLILASFAVGVSAARCDAVVFESDPVRPIALSPDGTRLFVVNTPDARLEILRIDAAGLTRVGSVPVGLEPVAVAARDDGEVWVVNHLSDSVSVVDTAAAPPRVVRTLLVGDEPRDIVFAGAGRARAFISAAHRGQNTPFAADAGAAGEGRADVWVFAAADPGDALGGEPLAIVNLFADKPRALAASSDGGTVYASIFQSGNRTTTLPAEAVCEGGSAAPPCLVGGLEMPGGLPEPNQNLDGISGPETGLIARFDPATGSWLDELGRDWRNAARFSLPDRDVFAIDALDDPPAITGQASGVGTVIFGMAVNPVSGAVYVANTEARNDVRLESRVRGRLHEARITVVEAGAVTARHLNKHLDYDVVPSPAGAASASLATPLALAVSSDGTTLYVAAFGSGKVALIDTAELEDDSFTPDASSYVSVTGGGPSGLALDEPRGRLYVSTRFDDGVSVVDLATRAEIFHLRLHDPEPLPVVQGRSLLYDAAFTSSNGEASCASCHVFADFDGLAWDLGREDLAVQPNPLPLLQTAGRDDEEFHPLKGPMVTQTLRGMATHGSMHWRGDRTGGNDPGGDVGDERAAFAKFNVSFVSLLGRAAPLSSAEMDRLTDFVLAIELPPNPHAPLDGSLTPAQATGRDAFFAADCASCHILDPQSGFFGTNGSAAVSAAQPQFMKVPHLRNLYQKIGRVFGVLFDPLRDVGDSGEQVRGFGFSHDGSAGRIDDAAGEFLFAFPTGLAPVVGQQITLTATNLAVVAARLDLLRERADAGDCDLVVKGVVGGEARGWMRTLAGTFASDREIETNVDESVLRALAATPGQELTFTCAAPGTGTRMGLDRDADGVRDRDEIDQGSDPADPESTAPRSDAWVVYRVASTEPFFPLGPLTLTGEQDEHRVDVKSPVGLALPARSGDAEPLEALTLRTAYHVRSHRSPSEDGPERPAALREVRIVNECSDVLTRLGAPDTLLLPARASQTTPPAPPLENEHDLDHLVCHGAASARTADDGDGVRLSRGIQLELGDALQRRRYNLVALTRVCLPVAMQGSPVRLRGPHAGEPVEIAPVSVRHGDVAYACYRIERARRLVEQLACRPALAGDRGTLIRPAQPRHQRQRGIVVADQLGSLPVDTRAERELCLPSRVLPVPSS